VQKPDSIQLLGNLFRQIKALGCCASQVGPEAQGAVVMLNKELGLSQGKISRFFQAFFGIQLTRGGSCQIMLRCAERCEGNYQAIVKWVRQSEWIVPDETGWRIGEDYAGKLIHDGWASYDRFWRAIHQTCLAQPHGSRSGSAVDSDDGAVHGTEVETGWIAIREPGSVFTTRSSTHAVARHRIGR
jgi:hypothetical protein